VAKTHISKEELFDFIKLALHEDVGEGDHTSLACIPADSRSKAKLLVKDAGILAGVEFAKYVFEYVDPSYKMEQLKNDGDDVIYGDIAFYVECNTRALLQAERLILNTMQRMSGIATLSSQFAFEVQGTKAKILDTRKTTPNFRVFEKWAVRIGGGHNHRFGLYDMIMLKDNHIDFCGGIKKAILAVKSYQEVNGLQLPVEVETRSLQDIHEVMETGFATRIMFDNFTIENTYKAVELVNGQFETESSGGINLSTIKGYAETGVNFISVGALTHSSISLDLSLKAI
jgi:nicotinate-nucleotide pyrophosphorylase (carboxylating)